MAQVIAARRAAWRRLRRPVEMGALRRGGDADGRRRAGATHSAAILDACCDARVATADGIASIGTERMDTGQNLGWWVSANNADPCLTTIQRDRANYP
jgi:hypothetical protein